MSEYTVENFVRGIDNIDRAKREIEVVVTRLTRFVEKYFSLFPPPGYYLITGGGGWAFEYSNGLIELTRVNGHTLYLTNVGYQQPAVEDVKQIHNDLQKLIDGVLQQFPDVAKQMALFMEAADLF
jgi:hypothetical protein